jgi:hypothetical protein
MVLEKTSLIQCDSGTNQAETDEHVMLEADEDGRVIVDAQDMTMSDSRQLLGEPNSHQNERVLETMQVWGCMVKGRLIRIVWYYLYQNDAILFGSAFHKNSTIKHA